MAILIAHGLRYILAKWYDLFPDNPYARISAIFPIGIFLGIMIIGGITHFLFGYRYVPIVADKFNNDLELISTHLDPGSTLYVLDQDTEYNFFQILDDQKLYIVKNELPTSEELPASYSTLGLQSETPGVIQEIITSPKSDNSDRIYVYNNMHEIDSSNQE